MTRINANLKMRELTDSHLKAEHREIIRVCYRYKKRLDKGMLQVETLDKLQFKLGSGHELFFTNKCAFTLRRFKQLHQESIDRGFKLTDWSSLWHCYNVRHVDNDWSATASDNDTIRLRIAENIIKSKQVPRYKKQNITKLEAIQMLEFETIEAIQQLFKLLCTWAAILELNISEVAEWFIDYCSIQLNYTLTFEELCKQIQQK